MNASPPELDRAQGAPKWALRAVSGLLALALVASVVGGVLWTMAALGGPSAEDTARSTARAEFLSQASQATLNYMTVDPVNTDQMIENIRSSSAGEMADGLEDPELRDQFTALVKEQGVTRVPKVVSITASKFDPDAGTGQVLVFVTQLVTWGEDNKAVARRGYSFDMQQVDDVWKIGLMTELFEGMGAAPAQGADGAGQGAAPEGAIPEDSIPDGLAPAAPGSAGN